jgi:hypothetical protein
MLQAQDGDVVGGEVLRLLAKAGLVSLVTAVAVLALPDRFIEAFDRTEKRFPLDRLGYALAVDRRVTELQFRYVEKAQVSGTLSPSSAAAAPAAAQGRNDGRSFVLDRFDQFLGSHLLLLDHLRRRRDANVLGTMFRWRR